MRTLTLVILLATIFPAFATEITQSVSKQEKVLSETVEQLDKPLYNPFIERYLIDEVKNLRVEMNRLEVSLNKTVVDRELETVSKVANYATDTVTYFFYLIAGMSSLLVLVGWTSLRDIKGKVKTLADAKVNQVVDEYAQRLEKLEKELYQKTKGFSKTQQKLTEHQDIHSLWLKAAQENLTANKINIYDQILAIDPADAEALTYKADAALELDEPQWAINLCNQALQIEPENSHAYYQLAGAYTLLNQSNEAILNLEKSIQLSGNFSEQILQDAIFEPLHHNKDFIALIESYRQHNKEK